MTAGRADTTGMLALALVLLILGLIFAIKVLWVIGVVLLIAAAIFYLVPVSGGGRRPFRW